MSVWHTIDVLPHRPMMVELFRKNYVVTDQHGEAHLPEPANDYRRELGRWDGKCFREQGTGHDAFECYHGRQDWLPTHWRALPDVPEAR